MVFATDRCADSAAALMCSSAVSRLVLLGLAQLGQHGGVT